jgi:L-fuconate dehydratase
VCRKRVPLERSISRGTIDVVRSDARPIGSPSEVPAAASTAAGHGPILCPRGGGVGPSEDVQHPSMIEGEAVSGSRAGRAIDRVDRPQGRFKDPCVVRNMAYGPSTAPGYSGDTRASTLDADPFRG